MSNQSNNLFDNTISGDNYYYSNMKYQGDGIYSNTFVQVGLDISDIFQYQDESEYTQSYNLKNDYNFILNDDADKECTMTELKRCDAYKK